MNLKSLLFLIIFAIWCVICWRYYTCEIKGFCTDNGDIFSFGQSKPPIQFGLNSDSLILNNPEKWIDSIKSISKNGMLDIVGYYFKNEVNNTSFANLGMARASQLMSYLVKMGIDSSSLITVGQLIDSNQLDFPRIATSIFPSRSSIDSTSKDVQIKTNYGVTEIYFPENSSKQILSHVLDSFLMTISADTSKIIKLIGHTDNLGSEESNLKLSLDRCAAIQSKLQKIGFPMSKIVSEAKGSSMPKVNNNTPSNRALNRRVEVKIQ